MPNPSYLPCTAIAASVLAAFALTAPAARAQFLSFTADATVANGNPLNQNYGTNVILLGAQADINATRVPNVHIDIVDPAVFTYSNLVGRGVEAYSNTIVTVTGGNIGNGLGALDQSDVTINGGTIRGIGTGVGGGATGTTNPHMTVNTGATIFHNQAGNAAAYISIGTLKVNGGSIANTSNNGEGIRLLGTGTAQVQGGTIQAINTQDSGVLSMTGGTVNGLPGSNAQAVILQSTVAASISGGTINGGLLSYTQQGAGWGNADISGTATINDGIFSQGDKTGAINVYGGTFGVASPATFFALGAGNINFFGSDLTLSLPTPGSYTMPQGIGSATYLGNFFTLTGTLRDGQAINRVLFDAISANGSTTGFGGGFTLNTIAVGAPEPSSLALLLAATALPFGRRLFRRR